MFVALTHLAERRTGLVGINKRKHLLNGFRILICGVRPNDRVVLGRKQKIENRKQKASGGTYKPPAAADKPDWSAFGAGNLHPA